MGTTLSRPERPLVAVPLADHGLRIGSVRPETPRLTGPIDGLLLDACNVLYDDTQWRRWLLRLLARLGLHTNYCSFFRVWDRDYLDEVHAGRRPFGEALGDFLLSVGLSRGQIEEVMAACQAHRRSSQDCLRPLTGIRGTLEKLQRAGLVLGVISNCEHPADVLRGQLDQLLGGPLVAAVISSRDLERTMPDPACYRAALAALELPADRVAFVGHDPAQLAGAAAVGMPTIAFNWDADARADIYIDCFEELLPLAGGRLPRAAAG